MDIHVSKELRRFNHLLGELNGVYHEASVKLGMSDSAIAVLYTLCCEGDPCPLHEVVRQSGMTKQTINSAIRKLEGEGAIRLEAAGGRGKNIHLTERGRELAQRTAVPLIEMEDEIYASWTREELRTYLGTTERFLKAMREKTKRL